MPLARGIPKIIFMARNGRLYSIYWEKHKIKPCSFTLQYEAYFGILPTFQHLTTYSIFPFLKKCLICSTLKHIFSWILINSLPNDLVFSRYIVTFSGDKRAQFQSNFAPTISCILRKLRYLTTYNGQPYSTKCVIFGTFKPIFSWIVMNSLQYDPIFSHHNAIFSGDKQGQFEWKFVLLA